jgi:hypothetical protein
MYLIVISGINLLNWLSAYVININVSRDLVVLHYNVDFGVNLIGNVRQIYTLPLLGLIIFLVNFIILVFIFKRNYRLAEAKRVFSHVLLASALGVNLFLFIALTLIYLINFFI